VLKTLIERLHRRSDGTYGAPRIQDDLKELGEHASRKRIARLLRELGLQGVTRRKGVWTTVRDPEAHPVPDRVQRDFTATGPNQLWVADITYVSTWENFLYLAVVLDVWSRRVVGWAMATHLRTDLVLDALDMAVAQRRPTSVIHHSDRGCQYTSIAFSERCRHLGVDLSMGSTGDCYDNALCESFFATLECELLDRRRFRTRHDARSEIFRYIEGWYNPHRRHSSIGRMSPMNLERLQMAA
jgi:putative transposase